MQKSMLKPPIIEVNDIQRLIIAFCHLPKGERTPYGEICPQVYKRICPTIYIEDIVRY